MFVAEKALKKRKVTMRKTSSLDLLMTKATSLQALF